MTSASIQKNDIDAARDRGLYILAVACFPAVLAGILTLIVFSSGAVQRDDGIGHNTEFAQFNYPTPGDLVSDQFELSGAVKSIPRGESVYIAEFSEGRYWPKRHLGSSPTRFQSEHFAKPGAGYKYSVVLLSVGSAGASQIDAWFEHGNKTGKYPGIAQVNDSKILARTRIIHQ